MVRLFQIFSVVCLAVAVIVAGVILVDVFTAKSDVNALIDSPSAYELYKEKTGLIKQAATGSEHPLVNQAKQFALRINPPAPVEPPKQQTTERPSSPLPTPPVRSAPLYTKFSVLGTVYNSENPSRSMALLDIAGTGKKWVFQGENVNRVVIEKVTDGKISYNDNGVVNDMYVPIPETKSLLKEANGKASQKPTIQEVVDRVRQVAPPRVTDRRSPSRTAPPAAPQLSPEEIKAMQKENINWLENLSGKSGNMDISEEEAKEIAEFAEMLKNLDKKEEK